LRLTRVALLQDIMRNLFPFNKVTQTARACNWTINAGSNIVEDRSLLLWAHVFTNKKEVSA